MDIKCVFYAEFDLKAGPIILNQFPARYIESDTFKAMQTYIIPSKALCGNLIILNLPPSLALIALPAELTRLQYPRGSFEFNLGMIVSAQALQNFRKPLERILRQIAYTLTLMELEQDLLSTGDKFWISEFI